MNYNFVPIEEYSPKTKEDLYSVIICSAGRDYHGNLIPEHKSVWEIVENLNTFVCLLNMLSDEEVYDWRGEYDENILSALAESKKSIDYFKVVLDYLGDARFYELLLTKDRRGLYPISLVTDIVTFVVMLDNLNIDVDILRQICNNNTYDTVDHLACMINSVSSIEVARKNGIL